MLTEGSAVLLSRHGASVCTGNLVRIDLVNRIAYLGVSLFKSKSRLEAENAALRHHLTVLRRKSRSCSVHEQRSPVSSSSCIVGSSILKAMTIVQPETVLRWHRAGFRRYWRWKSRSDGCGTPYWSPCNLNAHNMPGEGFAEIVALARTTPAIVLHYGDFDQLHGVDDLIRFLLDHAVRERGTG